MHSFFVCMLYFKEFQESIVNVKNSSVTIAHCSPKEQWVKFKVPATESHSELFLQSLEWTKPPKSELSLQGEKSKVVNLKEKKQNKTTDNSPLSNYKKLSQT